jgi:hypothetical protein
LPVWAASLGNYYSLQVGQRAIKILVQNDIFETIVKLNLNSRVAQPPRYIRGRIQISGAQASFENLTGGRHDENQDRLRHTPTHLLRALHVDIEHNIQTLREHFFYRVFVCAVEAAVDFCAFEELVSLPHRAKLIFAYKVIIDAVLLRASRLSGGVRD